MSIYTKLGRKCVTVENGKNGYIAPLHYKETYGYLLTGEYPCVKMIAHVALYGSLVFFDGERKAPFEKVRAEFYPNKTVYTIADGDGLQITILPSAQGAGTCVKMSGAHACVGIAWGGMTAPQNGSFAVRVAYDPGRGSTRLYDEEERKDTEITATENVVLLRHTAQKREARYRLDGATWMAIEEKGVTYTLISLVGKTAYLYGEAEQKATEKSAEEAFALSKERNEDEKKYLQIKTPDKRLDLATAFAVTASNATFVDDIYNHGTCAWSIPYLGWENIIGGVTLGRIDNIEREAKAVSPYVVRTDERKTASASVERKSTMQGDDSRIFGYGYVNIHQGRCYNMQSQYYDQLIYATNRFDSPVLEEILQKDLPLHSVWQDECFDPQGEGVYESYINTFPTDSVWYNGGKGVEETAFAYAVNEYLYKATGEKKYGQKARKIKRAFRKILWVQEEGHPAFYKDVIGEKLLHKEPWNYSVFYAVNTGLTDIFEKAQATYFAEYGLETVERGGGKSTYSSNFVPYVWSVRDLDLQYDYQTAETYFNADLYDTGFAKLRDAYVQCFSGRTPCSITGKAKTTNFASTVALYLRAVADGLFGVRYTDKGKRAQIKPAFPRGWKKAEFATKKLSYTYERTQNKIIVDVDSDCEQVTLVLPNYFQTIEDVKGGRLTMKKSMLYAYLQVTAKGKGRIEITLSGKPRYNGEKYIRLSLGEKKRIQGLIDPQGVFAKGKAVNEGYHTVFADRGTHFDVYRVCVEAQKGEDNAKIEGERIALPIEERFNGDITKVYEQKYLSPRVDTCSAQLGVDGFSTWTGVLWKTKPPTISLEGYAGEEILGEPFTVRSEGNNALLLSQYDNYPTSAEIPVGQSAKGVCILFAGTTNAMQCQVPAMRITAYLKGGERIEKEVVPPYNFLGVADCVGTGQDDHESYYADPHHQFPLRHSVARTQVIGNNCRVNILYIPTDGRTVEKIRFQVLANETVMGIMGIHLIQNEKKNNL